MTRSDLSLIAVRILALYLIAVGLMMLPVAVSISAFGRLDASYVFACSSPLALGVVAFALSRRLAAWVTPSSDRLDSPAATVSSVQQMAIATFGLFLIAVTVPTLITSVLLVGFRNAGQQDPDVVFTDAQVIGESVSLLLGVLLSTGAAYWTRLLAKFRDLGHEQSSDNQEP